MTTEAYFSLSLIKQIPIALKVNVEKLFMMQISWLDSLQLKKVFIPKLKLLDSTCKGKTGLLTKKHDLVFVDLYHNHLLYKTE